MFLLVFSYLADLVFGDPERFFHPVRAIGKLINILETKLRKNNSRKTEQIKGVILTLLVVGVTVIFTYLLIESFKKLNPFVGALAWVYIGYTTISVRDLNTKAKDISRELKNNSIVEARRKLSKIVGRDTQDLDQERIITATIESIAENTNDGIVAPLFYLALGGPVLAMAYKAINTLDSMVGYKDDKYLNFGWFSAKLDDLANFIPARICGFLISVSSSIVLRRFKDSFKMMLRDGRKHLSPNSGVSQAAMAGALGIRLGGISVYRAQIIEKPYIGEEKNLIALHHINEALLLSLITSFLMLSIGVFLKWII